VGDKSPKDKAKKQKNKDAVKDAAVRKAQEERDAKSKPAAKPDKR
jgi:hypothetical protein